MDSFCIFSVILLNRIRSPWGADWSTKTSRHVARQGNIWRSLRKVQRDRYKKSREYVPAIITISNWSFHRIELRSFFAATGFPSANCSLVQQQLRDLCCARTTWIRNGPWNWRLDLELDVSSVATVSLAILFLSYRINSTLFLLGSLHWERFLFCYLLFKWHDQTCRTLDQSHTLHV